MDPLHFGRAVNKIFQVVLSSMKQVWHLLYRGSWAGLEVAGPGIEPMSLPWVSETLPLHHMFLWHATRSGNQWSRQRDAQLPSSFKQILTLCEGLVASSFFFRESKHNCHIASYGREIVSAGYKTKSMGGKRKYRLYLPKGARFTVFHYAFECSMYLSSSFFSPLWICCYFRVGISVSERRHQPYSASTYSVDWLSWKYLNSYTSYQLSLALNSIYHSRVLSYCPMKWMLLRVCWRYSMISQSTE